MSGEDATRRIVDALAPPVGGAILALGALLAAPTGAADRRPHIAPAYLAGSRAEDCAPCHALEVAEWRGSAMAFAIRSPLVGALESLVEEQVGRDASCPSGAGVLRTRGADACIEARTGVSVTG